MHVLVQYRTDGVVLKGFMNIRFVLVLCACSLHAVCSNSAAGNTAMAAFKTSYTSNLAAIVSSSTSTDGLARYGKSLDGIADALKKDGDLDGVVAVREEKRRFDAEKTVPTESAADVIPAIAKARSDYHQSCAKGDIENSKRILALADSYAANLETLKKQLTQQDKIEEATEVKQEIDRLRSSPEVTSAQFVIADLTAKTAPATTTPKAKSDTSPSAPQKSSKTRKAIESKGDSSGEWTRTMLAIKTGDTVTISASGSWKCTGLNHACGPDGYNGRGVGSWVKASGRRRQWLSYGWGRYVQDSQYGALVCKVGEDGQVRVVGSTLTFTSTEEGRLFLDANVATGRDARQGCSGSISVEIEVQHDASQ